MGLTEHNIALVDKFAGKNDERDVTQLVGTLLGYELTVDMLEETRRKNSELHKIIEELKRQAFVDEKMGVLNYAAFKKLAEKRANETLAKKQATTVRNPDQETYVVFIDLDGFKDVNDTFGHRFGDYVLAEVGHRLRNTFSRDEDVVARYGGDEIILLAPYSSAEALEKTVRSVFEDMIYTKELGNDEYELYPIGASIGIERFDENIPLGDLIKQVDVKTYDDKQHKAVRQAQAVQRWKESQKPEFAENGWTRPVDLTGIDIG